jgi:hypothetical protein
MGLDGVEIVMAVEDAFGIAIADEEAAKVRTPRDLINLVCSKLQLSTDARCVSHRAFHHVRRELMNSFDVRRSDIRPSVRLEDLLPANQRRESWCKLRQALRAEVWPALQPTAAHWWLAALPGIGASALLNWGGSVANWISTALVASMIVVGSAFLVIRATHRLGRDIPTECFTVGDLALFLVQHNRELFATPAGREWNPVEVSAVVRKVIGDTLAIRDFSDDADLVKDLGLS